MASLLSVLLVASSASGSRLLFAYPPNAVATPRVQKPLYGKTAAVRDAQQRSSDALHGNDGNGASKKSSNVEKGHRRRRSRRSKGEGPQEDRKRNVNNNVSAATASRSTTSDEGGSTTDSDNDDDDDDNRRAHPAAPADIYASRFIRGESSSSSSAEEGLDSGEEDEDEEDGGSEVDEDYLQDVYDTREKRERENYKIHLGLDTSVLGSLLCPNKELCNKRFEMVINHLAFISHPACTSRARRQERTRSRHAGAGGSSKGRGRERGPGQNKDGDAGAGQNVPESTFVSDEEEDNGDQEDRDDDDEFGSESLAGSRQFGEESRGRSAPNSTLSSRRTSRSNHTSGSVPPNRAHLFSENRSAAGSRGSSQNRRSSHSASNSPSGAPPDRHLPPSRSFPHHSHAFGLSTIVSGRRASDDTSSVTPSPRSKPQEDYSTSSTSELDVWGVVLVIDCPPDQHLSYHLSVYYRDVVVPLMAALKYEERRDGYVTRQVAKISSLREKAEDTGIALTAHTNDLIKHSSLCAQLAALYHGIKKENLATLTLNEDIEMSVLLHSELFDDTYNPAALTGDHHSIGNNAGSLHPTTYDRHTLSLRKRQLVTPYDTHRLDLTRLSRRLTGGLLEDGPPLHINIAPWQSLLPLQDPEDMLSAVDDDDGVLSRFLEIMSPSLTFTEYETLLDTDSESIIEIAEHLIYWRKARLIDALSLKGIYVPIRPARSGPTKLLADWSRDFAMDFPELPSLPVLLATLSSPQPFETIVPPGSKYRSVYMEALTWLLQQDLVTQLRVYMNLVATPEIKRLAYEKEEARQKRRRSMSTSEHSAGEEDDRSQKSTTRGTSRSPASRGGGESGISNQSNISITSHNTSQDSSNEDDASSSHLTYTNTRSPLPRSFPQNYPYISAASASTANRPKSANLHNRGLRYDHQSDHRRSSSHRMSSGARRTFLSALNAPSIIANPSEPSSEEELWIAEMVEQVKEAKGSDANVAVFNRMLPFLDGTHHLDEILYRAGLSRKAVRGVLADFDSFLVSFVN